MTIRSSEPGEEVTSRSKVVGLGAGHQPEGESAMPSRTQPVFTGQVWEGWTGHSAHWHAGHGQVPQVGGCSERGRTRGPPAGAITIQE